MTKSRRVQQATMFSFLLIATLAVAGCSAASDTTGGTSPLARAMLSVDGTPITVCGDSCVFEGRGANRGIGCAKAIRGTTRVSKDDGTTLASVAWTLDPTWVVRPGESFLFDGCCFDQRIMEHTVTYETDFLWDDVSCPAS